MANPFFSNVRCALATLAMCCAFHAAAQDTIRIGVVEPFTGPAVSTTEAGQDNFNDYVRAINAQGGMLGKKLELVPYDSKANPQESVAQVQKAINDGVRIVVQAQSSSVALAISDFVQKYNLRNAGKEVLYLNYDSIDPALTNEKCNFWHFRFSPGIDMRAQALVSYLFIQPKVKKIYLINQDYSYGRTVSAEFAKRIRAMRPDIEIVGNELHPLLKVIDFSAQTARIRASGADTVVTGNWGPDIALLFKSAAASGLNVDWLKFYADAAGGHASIKEAGLKNRVFILNPTPYGHLSKAQWEAEKNNRTKYRHATMYPHGNTMLQALVQAGNQVGTFDINRIARQLEGLRIDIATGGQGYVRPEDHQFVQPLYISKFGDFDPATGFEEEGTGWGWQSIFTIRAAYTTVPTTCAMMRPTAPPLAPNQRIHPASGTP